jgi:hypothetical protein
MMLTVTEIVDHMVEADNARMAVFSGYTGLRRYTFENKKFKKHAEMTVRVVGDQAGAKTFEVALRSPVWRATPRRTHRSGSVAFTSFTGTAGSGSSGCL